MRQGNPYDPRTFSEIKGGRKASPETLYNFANDLYKGYKEIMSGDRNVLFKLKEFWIYFSKNFDEPDKVLKMVRKADTCIQYEVAVGRILGFDIKIMEYSNVEGVLKWN